MKLIKTGNKKWQNRHETFTEKIKELYIVGNEPSLGALQGYNDTTKGLQKLVKDANDSGTPIRMLGAGWSWTKIATVEQGIMVDTNSMNIMMSISAPAVSPDYDGDITKLVFAQCGTSIWELNSELRKNNLSLKTCGASNGQTIVGAMSTGAHGSTIDIGGVQDYVVGMHIIVSSNRHIWLERKSYPVVSNTLISNLETELVQDDDLFNAALVSFGSMGIIHGVLLEAEDLFLLETHMQRIKYDASLKKAMASFDFSGLDLPHNGERPFHFSVSINPYDKNNEAYVYTYYKRDYTDNYERPVPNAAGVGPGDDAPCFIGKITNAIPKLVPVIVNEFISSRMTTFENVFGTLGEIFNNTDLHGKLLSTAIGIPQKEVNKVTELLFKINKSHGPFLGIFAYRFVKSTQATLGFTRFPEFTCILELDGAFSKKTLKLYEAFWNALFEEDIPFTFHWGKMNQINPDRIVKMYGSKAQSWKAARHKLLDSENIKIFTNPLLKEWGLDN